MKNIRIFLSENFPFLVVKFSIYLNRRVFVMKYSYRHAWANSVDSDYTPQNASDQICNTLHSSNCTETYHQVGFRCNDKYGKKLRCPNT